MSKKEACLNSGQPRRAPADASAGTAGCDLLTCTVTMSGMQRKAAFTSQLGTHSQSQPISEVPSSCSATVIPDCRCLVIFPTVDALLVCMPWHPGQSAGSSH